jgi:signal transduction histidine kinase
MKARSLRVRLLLVASAAILLALAIAGFGLVQLFERHVERRIGSELDTYLNQIASRIIFNADQTPRLDGKLADPRFDQVYSGLYWQITDEKLPTHIRSRSLWDTQLDLPVDMPPVGTIHIHDISGPQNAKLLIHERRLVFDTGKADKILRLAVAIDRAGIAALSTDFAADVTISLLILAAILILAAWIQVNVGLKPLSQIRHGLTNIREGKSNRLDVHVPSEIAPLAEEVNDLLAAQDKAIQKARDRAADLAHGFKTPLTALLADAKRLRDKGDNDTATEIERTATLMRGHIDRELTRSRIRNIKPLDAIEVGPALQGLIGTLKRTPQGETIKFTTNIKSDLTVSIEPDDLNEVLGNLLENAVRHAYKKVCVRAVQHNSLVRFDVEDDGPGIAEAQIKTVTSRGNRLDSSAMGAGLGLAIVSDVLDHYGQILTLERSKLGGLKVSFALEG